MFDITPILESLITILCAIITGLLIPYLRKKLSNATFDNISKWVNVAVSCAEQVYGEGKGKDKKQFVLNYLNSKGLTYDQEAIDVLIESAVQKL